MTVVLAVGLTVGLVYVLFAALGTILSLAWGNPLSDAIGDGLRGAAAILGVLVLIVLLIGAVYAIWSTVPS